MNLASTWRLELGKRISRAYSRNPRVQVVMAAGSTGRGTADRYSDLEIDIYWSSPPTDEERSAAVTATGGTLVELFAYEDDEWAEEISFGGFHVGTSAFLVRTMERYVAEVVEGYSTANLPQMRLSSLLNAQTLVGEALVAGWRAKAKAYPVGLVHAMLRKNLMFEGFGYAEDALAARDDLLFLYDSFCHVERQILGALLGLNRLYLPHPCFKNMDETIARMALTPPHLSERLKSAFSVPAPEGVGLLHTLIEDVFALTDRHVSGFDTAPYRNRVQRRRGVWETPPSLPAPPAQTS